MTPFQQRWVDEPIRSKDDDTLQRAHLAEHAARLMAGTHSWEASVVFGLTGPWGSGKTSLVELIVEELQKQSSEWRVARFTPWATNDTASLMAEFFASLEAALPRNRGKAARKALGTCATVVAPWLKLLPVVGAPVGESTKALGEAASRSQPWHQAFAEASTQLKELNTPVLVVADDIDRLQADELVALLKVVRLLGRFPGVHYLLAYDEQTLLENLQHAGVGVADAHRARLFMEKIVQYPLAIPPLLPHQMQVRLADGLDAVLSDHERVWDEDDHRIGQLMDVLQSQLATPRSIDRLMAQLRHYLPLHDPAEINDVDLILLTFLHLQFPALYNSLPRWRAELTGVHQQWMRLSGEHKNTEPDWDRLLEVIPAEDARRDARRVLEELFPVMRHHSMGSQSAPKVCVPEYFNRYFAHTIPQADIADTDIRAALVQASAPGSTGEQLLLLLTDPYPGRAELVLRKLRDLYSRNTRVQTPPPVTVDLIRVAAQYLDTFEPGPRSLLSNRDECLFWVADLLRQLPTTASAQDVRAALEACSDWDLSSQLLHLVLTSDGTPPPVITVLRDVAWALAVEISEHLLTHLSQLDEADLQTHPLTGFRFVSAYGNQAALREKVLAGLEDHQFTVEDLAARFVSLQHLIRRPTPRPRIGDFTHDTFAHYAPDHAEFYTLVSVEELDEWDVSWANRRTYARGRAQPPTTPDPD